MRDVLVFIYSFCCVSAFCQRENNDSCIFARTWLEWSDMNFPEESNLHIFWRPYQDCSNGNCLVGIIPDCSWKDVCFSIYNQWGELMFDSDGTSFTWEVSECETGNFVYVISYLDLENVWKRRLGNFIIFCESD